MEGQQSLTLRWHTFSWRGREHFTFSVAYKGSQYFVHYYVQPITLQITQDTSPRIVDAPLTLIFMMGQRVYDILICLGRQPILCLRLFATYCPPDYPTYRTKNRWRSVDAHFPDVAGSVSHSLFSIQAANTSFMTICNWLPTRLPKIHDQGSSTLRWRSFCHGCIHHMQSFDFG